MLDKNVVLDFSSESFGSKAPSRKIQILEKGFVYKLSMEYL